MVHIKKRLHARAKLPIKRELIPVLFALVTPSGMLVPRRATSNLSSLQLFLLLGGEKHYESRAFCPKTHPLIKARVRTRTSLCEDQSANHKRPRLLDYRKST